MPNPILLETAAALMLDPEPIPKDWVLSGNPEATSKKLAKSADFTSYIMVWECTPGRFTWHYNKDETLVVVSGEVFITNEKGQEQRLGPGDFAFFPGGTSASITMRTHTLDCTGVLMFRRYRMSQRHGCRRQADRRRRRQFNCP